MVVAPPRCEQTEQVDTQADGPCSSPGVQPVQMVSIARNENEKDH